MQFQLRWQCCVVQWVWQRLPKAEQRRSKDLLVNTMASTIYYNPTAAVAWLNQQQQLQPFLETWGQVCISTNKSICCILSS